VSLTGILSAAALAHADGVGGDLRFNNAERTMQPCLSRSAGSSTPTTKS